MLYDHNQSIWRHVAGFWLLQMPEAVTVKTFLSVTKQKLTIVKKFGKMFSLYLRKINTKYRSLLPSRTFSVRVCCHFARYEVAQTEIINKHSYAYLAIGQTAKRRVKASMITFNLIWSQIEESETNTHEISSKWKVSRFEIPTQKRNFSLIQKLPKKKKFKFISALFHEKKCDYVGQRQGYDETLCWLNILYAILSSWGLDFGAARSDLLLNQLSRSRA